MLFNIQSKKLLKLVMVTILLVTLLVFLNRSDSVKADVKKDYSGEEIYKGIVLGQGKVATLFPQVWDEEQIRKVNSKESSDLTTKLLNEMKLSDPSYFNNLKKAVDSKEPLIIQQAFENGSYLLNQAINKLKLNSYNSKSQNRAGLGLIAIVDNSKYYITYYAAPKESLEVSSLANVKTSKKLEQEQLIQNVVNQLSY
ncbi:sporulation delaying protein family toxin [Bacillus mycoides]|uniref:sporulation delaying protein family toxin n=1 Tax=Bacillus mycoides TaxID=1405 RepID=UPI0036718349